MYRNITIRIRGTTRVVCAERIESTDLRQVGATQNHLDAYYNTDPLHIYKYADLYYMRGVHEADQLSAEDVLDVLQWMYEGKPDPQDIPDDI